MLLCDGCDRGHHIYCLKPKLKSIPKDDWYCAECKPKERVRSPKKTVTDCYFPLQIETCLIMLMHWYTFQQKKMRNLAHKKKKEFLLKCMCSIPVSRNCRNSVAGSAGFQLDGGERGRRRGGPARAGQGRRQRGKSSQGACWEMAALN